MIIGVRSSRSPSNLKRVIKRFVTLGKRNRRARRFGFHFNRAASFAVPSEIQIERKRFHMSLPDDHGTKTAFVEIFLDDCYRLHELPNDVQNILDIGCHVGLFSIAARDRWPRAVIHAYEPNSALRYHLENHATQLGVSVFWEAVGLVSASVTLVPNADSVQTRSIETDHGEVAQVSFNKAVTRLGGRVDLVKLDCEGAEWAIFQDEESWKHVHSLTMEFHLWAGYTLEELKVRLSKLGFKIRHLDMTGRDYGLLLAGR